VAHTYDLLLQARTLGEAAPVASLVTALLARGAKLDSAGRGVWKLSDEVVIEPLLEEGQVRGLDVRVPLLDKTLLIEEVVKNLTEVAEGCEARVTDPQRGDAVTIGTLGLVLEEYLRMARYAGEYGGVSGALGLSSYGTPPEEDSTALRWVLIVGVFLIAVWASWNAIDAMREANRPEEPPAPMNGPPKIPGK
jgi:hypothetical protein